ncbi:saccharopine dehydrogenase family protein [Haladaptatus caseinilyticus]|uniref:saccharopine dehydrogenase family protein n=1 Tax=Haladaptatus caseinilyticus TaxID=2993314 RepID=UPI00224AC25B|nr:saccharopine dehydrogenase NADP-binding domain-containing protein [Haladaptatus caseinilyticus]
MTDELLIYGSYGYTGALVAKTAVDEGESPVLAGRQAEAVEAQATELGLDHQTFSLEHPAIIEQSVSHFDAVLNCAGPFSSTATPLIDACLETGTDYLDITGQIDVLESIAERDDDAIEADVTLLPAVGFDVVPTDCLAVYLADQVDNPTRLRLALDGLQTFSPGTGKSIVEGLHRPGAVHENGEIRDVPPAWRTRTFAFDGMHKKAVTVPWGDVSTAFYATNIPNIETYATVPEYAIKVMKRSGKFTRVLGSKPVQAGLKTLIDNMVSGPTAAQREQNVTRVVGEVETDDGEQVSAHLQTPDTYDLTAKTAIESARRVLDNGVEAGFLTPGEAFGSDYVLTFPGVERRDIDSHD